MAVPDTPHAASASYVAARVRAAQREAREQRRRLDALAELARRDPQAFKLLHEEMALLILGSLLDLSRQERRYLRSGFGYDVARVRFRDPPRRPRTQEEWGHFIRAYDEWLLHRCAFVAMGEAFWQAMAETEHPWRAALLAYVGHLRRAPWLWARRMVLTPFPTLREEAVIKLSGWLATKVNPRFGRLARGLGGGRPVRDDPAKVERRLGVVGGGLHLPELWKSNSIPREELEQVLFERLPGATLEGFGDLDPNTDLKTLINHVSNLLSVGRDWRRSGTRRQKQRPPTALGTSFRIRDSVFLTRLLAQAEAAAPPDDSVLRDVAARAAASEEPLVDEEELRTSVGVLRAHYGLSERQAEVYHLNQVAKWPHGRIATRLGISADTSRVQLHRAQKKLAWAKELDRAL